VEGCQEKGDRSCRHSGNQGQTAARIAKKVAPNKQNNERTNHPTTATKRTRDQEK